MKRLTTILIVLLLMGGVAAQTVSRRLLREAYMTARNDDEYKENATDSALVRYAALLPRLDSVDQSICHALLAQCYHDYLQGHRWTIRRNEVTDEAKLDYRLWPEERYRDTIQRHLTLALAHPAVLQHVPVESVSEFCLTDGEGGDSDDARVNVTPTLYDVLVNYAIACSDDPAEQLRLHQRLVVFHAEEGECLRLCLEIEHLELLSSQSSRPKLTAKDYESCIDRYIGTTCDQVARLYYLAADDCYERGDYLGALRYCDSCTRRFGNCYFGGRCATLAEKIRLPHLSVEMLTSEIPGREMLGKVTSRNADRLYFRIVKDVDVPKDDEQKCCTTLAKQRFLEAWTLEVPHRDDHHNQTHYLYLPAMPPGMYLLLASTTEDFQTNGLQYQRFAVCDAQLLAATPVENAIEGYLLRRSDGSPIVGQRVELTYYDHSKQDYLPLGIRQTTDKQGFYRFATSKDIGYRSLHVRTVIDGVTLDHHAHPTTPDTSEVAIQATLLPDRPVYKPGETISFALLCYFGDGYQQGGMAADAHAHITLLDASWKVIDSLELVADTMGVCHGSFHIPENATPGRFIIRYSVELQNSTFTIQHLPFTSGRPIQVEAYKQPKFTVALSPAAEVRSFGREATYDGVAETYSRVPVSGARVIYRVERSQVQPPWLRWFRPVGKSSVVAQGTTMTDGEGVFHIAFVPLPDSNVVGSMAAFQYTLYVDVTDLNGETQSQQQSLRVGYESCHLELTIPDEVERIDSIPYEFLDLDGNTVRGVVTTTLQPLATPPARLTHPISDTGARDLIGREEFERRFPGYWYDSGDSIYRSDSTDKSYSVADAACTELQSGYYSVRVSAADPVTGETLSDSAVVLYQRPGDRQVVSTELFYSRVSTTRCEVGDTLTLQVGSRHTGVTLCYALAVGDRVVERRLIALTDQLQDILIPIRQEYLGGFALNLFAVKDNVTLSEQHEIEVPYSHKELEATFSSFRDKLQPGERETWTIHIAKDQTHAPIHANLTLTMFDAALDSYGTLPWSFHPWRTHPVHNLFAWSNPSYEGCSHQRTATYHDLPINNPLHWSLNGGFPVHGSRILYGSRRMVSKSLATVENDAMADNEIYACVEMAEESAPAQSVIPLRTHLNTLAFFAPTLRTDTEGDITYTFTVPELLTRWSIRGIAVTPDLEYAEFVRELVTQKQLMVQPNVPRFLRQGDKIDFLAKLSNLSDSGQQVTVTFTLTDTMSGDIVTEQRQVITVPAGSSLPVSFPLDVPASLSGVKYRIVAQGQSCSDGEQGAIPVLSNRELVTTSQSMYINGLVEKRYGIDTLRLDLGDESRTAVPHRFTLEFTANPIWLAAQALPYMEERENPSNIYLANSLYANAIANNIVQQYPVITETIRQWEQDTIGQRLAHYLDSSGITQRLAGDAKKLLDGQRSDGGWSWMPGGSVSSLYTTQYILKRLMFTHSHLNEFSGVRDLTVQDSGFKFQDSGAEALARALQYVDRENCRHYEQQRKLTTFEPINLEYLYLRSLYPGHAFAGKSRAAYDYYYANALKHHNEYKSLYSRALLALVFHRHGDQEVARQIVSKLKSIALYSDEMGMYWRDNVASYWWYERPVETQAMLIQAFAEVTPEDGESIGLMQQWLLKQRQTTSWSSDVSTADAIAALLCGSHGLALEEQPAEVQVGGIRLDTPAQAGAGCQVQHWDGTALDSLRCHLKTQPEIHIRKVTEGIGWGAAYYQYYEDIDKIPASAMGITLTRQLYVVQPNGDMKLVREGRQPDVGDRVRVRILLNVDRNMEYVQVCEGHASCCEPVSTASGWHRDGGISYYLAVRDASTTFYIERLEKGRYVIEQDLYVTNTGTFALPPTTAQCMYAPEFRSSSEGGQIAIR